jgi:secreted trypsin-like serine protease
LSLATTVPVTGTKVMVAGWGVTPESSIGSERLQYVEYATAADFICSQFMGAQFDGKKMICASEGIKGPCAGDSGGPVVYKTNVNDTHYTAIGLVSFGLAESCGETSIDVFTKIPTYLRWISENMPENSILVTTEPGPTSPQQKLVAPGPIIIATLQRYLFTGGITLVLGGLILVAAVVGLTIALCVMASEKRRIAHNAATEMAVYNRMYN